MAFWLVNGFMLLGMLGLAIPPLIHLLNRRRYDVVDWAAMQFLKVKETSRRKIFLEQLLLMLLRMGLIAVLVLAMCKPQASGFLFDRLGLGDNRDLVIVLDGSTVMSYIDDNGRSTHQKAVQWVRDLLPSLMAGDTVALLQAREQVVEVIAPGTSDLGKVREALDTLLPPRGACSWPAAVESANRLLHKSGRARREIILLGSAGKSGWADERTLQRWELLSGHLQRGAGAPRIWKVSLDEDRPVTAPDWALAPLRSGHNRATNRLTLRSSLTVQNDKLTPPHRLLYRIDRPEEDTESPPESLAEEALALTLPANVEVKDGVAPLTFSHTFTPGSHLVSLLVEPDKPGPNRPHGAGGRDRFAGDNRQDYAVMVALLPVLLIDGLPPHPGKYGGADFLQVALAPAVDRTRLVRARVEPLDQLIPALERDIGPEPNTRPRVLVLCDVPRLSPAQREAVDHFVAGGGGLLVTLGPRVDPVHFNRDLYRDGLGWLPAALDKLVGNADEPLPEDETKPDPAAHPVLSSFHHPALEPFRAAVGGGLGNARFPRYWNVSRPVPGSEARVVAELTTKAPLLIERRHGKGQVMLATVPLDASWGTNLQRLEVPEFPLLAYELAAYLGAARSVEYNLSPGQPLVYLPQDDEAGGSVLVKPPRGEAIPLESKEGAFVYPNTRQPGVYVLTTSRNRTIYYVVQPDFHTLDQPGLCTEEDRQTVAKWLPVDYSADRQAMLAGPAREVWWWLLLGVIALLCSEVWMTRRIVKKQTVR